MEKLDQEINNLADSLAKASTTPIETLKQTIIALGPEGLKKKMDELSGEEATLLKSVLDEMALEKAQKMDVENTPKKKMVKIKDLEVEVEESGDDEEEKLMDAKNATHPHQGDNSELPGQVIKAEKIEEKVDEIAEDEAEEAVEEHEEKMHKEVKKSEEIIEKAGKGEGSKGGKIIGHTKTGKPIYETGNKGAKGWSAGDHHEAYKTHLKLSQENRRAAFDHPLMKEVRESGSYHKTPEQAMATISQLDHPEAKKVQEHWDKDAHHSQISEHHWGKHKANLKKEDKPMKKSEENMELKTQIQEIKKSMEANGTVVTKELLKAEVEKQITPKKIISWADPNQLLKACTQGRNYNYSVNSFYNMVLNKSKDPEVKEEKLEKSEKDYNISDLIEKSLDTTWQEIEKQSLIKQYQGQADRTKFSDADLAATMGLSVEEANKLIGE